MKGMKEGGSSGDAKEAGRGRAIRKQTGKVALEQRKKKREGSREREVDR